MFSQSCILKTVTLPENNYSEVFFKDSIHIFTLSLMTSKNEQKTIFLGTPLND